MSKDLRQFLQVVKEAGPEFYAEVKKPLKPELEKDVIQLKLAKQGRFPVIYCPDIKGSKYPLVSNLFGSYELLGLAMDMNPRVSSKKDIFHEFRRRRQKALPVKVVPASESPVKEVILHGKDVDLDLLPITWHAELDVGKYITIGNLVSKDPDSGIPNVGVYRHMLKGRNQIGAWFAYYNHAGYHARSYAELGKPMDVAIFVGHHPAVVMGSLTAGDIDENEFELMGGFLGEPIRVTPAETVDLPIPADAEIVIEGTIDPQNMVTDAPFAEWPGYYGIKRPCYLIEVKCITMRHDAIYHDLANSQREHCVSAALGFTSTIYDTIRAVVPTVKDVYLPFSGRHNMIAYISIAQRVPGEAKRAALAAINVYPPVRIAVVVDEDINVYDEEEVLWAIVTRATPESDIDILTRVIGSPLNPTSYDETRLKRGTMVSKMIVDATKSVELPFPTRVTPPKDLWDSIKLEDYLK